MVFIILMVLDTFIVSLISLTHTKYLTVFNNSKASQLNKRIKVERGI